MFSWLEGRSPEAAAETLRHIKELDERFRKRKHELVIAQPVAVGAEVQIPGLCFSAKTNWDDVEVYQNGVLQLWRRDVVLGSAGGLLFLEALFPGDVIWCCASYLSDAEYAAITSGGCAG